MTTSTPPALLNLSDLSMRIDIRAFYEAHGAIVSGKPTNSKEGKEYSCSCPACGGTDRASFWSSGRFCCVRGCRAKCSSPYWFLRDIEGLSHLEALEELGIEPDEVDSYSQNLGNKLPLFLIKDEPPHKKWQEQAHLFCHISEYCLWSNKGETARNYLHSRGFTDTTIKAAHLGLNPDWYIKPLEDWGLDAFQLNKEDDPQIKIPRGITIPWYVGSSIWKIQLRRPEAGPDGKKYKEVLGSSDCLYMPTGFIDLEEPILLVESELDALSVHQEASDLITSIATGSTSKGQSSSSLTLLHQAPLILQAFDDDEAGHKGAEDWQRLIPSIVRHTPWAHDVNDMLRDGLPIRAWVELGLSTNEESTVQGEEKAAVFDALVQEEVQRLQSPPAVHYDKAGKLIPPELIEQVPGFLARLERFQSGKKICCDTLDWYISEDGYITCPCVKRAQEKNRLLDMRLKQEEQARKRRLGLIDW